MAAESQYTTIVATTRELCGQLMIACNDCANLDSIGRKSRGIMNSSLQELLTEMQEQGGKLITAIRSSRSAFTNLKSLQESLTEIEEFLIDLNNLTFVFASKAKYKRKCLDLAHSLNSKRTTLFNSVTMALLGQPNARSVNVKSMLSINTNRRPTPTSSAGTSPTATGFMNDDSSVDDASEVDSSSLIGSRSLPPKGPSAIAASVLGEDSPREEREREHAQLVASGGMQLFSVGHTHYYGIGRSRNLTLAFNAFKDAAEAGDFDGMHMLSRCYRSGHGCEKAPTKGYQWLLEL